MRRGHKRRRFDKHADLPKGYSRIPFTQAFVGKKLSFKRLRRKIRRLNPDAFEPGPKNINNGTPFEIFRVC